MTIEIQNVAESSPEKLPQTIFELADTKKEAELSDGFLENPDFVGLFRRFRPEIIKIQAESMEKGLPKEERLAKYKEFFDKIHTRDNDLMLEFRERLTKRWEDLAPEFLQALASHFETDWPEDKKITGYVTALPIYPRDLEEYSFLVGYMDLDSSIETCAHEIVHFLWFKKWKEVFPEIDKSQYNYPNLIWRLSEIMDPIILQCHQKIKDLIQPKRWGYKSFAKVQINGIPMLDHFKNIYLECVSRGDDFSSILKRLYEEALLHAEEIKKF